MSYTYVTLVAYGGTPVRLANQQGAPVPTTGTGALVFADGATLTNPTINGYTPNLPLVLPNGSISAPPVYWGTSDRGIYSTGTGNLTLVANGAALATFTGGNVTVPGNLAVTGNVNISGALTIATSLAVNQGGTGVATITANGIPYGSGTAPIGVTAAGTTGQILVGNTGAPPSWSTHSSVAVTSFSAGSTGLTPSSPTTGAVVLAGVLTGASGGTGVNNAGRTITLGGNVSLAGALTTAGAFTTSGAFATTFTMTGVTNVTFPTSGTLATTTTPSASVVVGGTAITGGATSRVLYDNGGVLGEYAISGSGDVAMTNSPTFVTPALGTPSALVLTNATGTPASIGLANGTGLPISTGVSGLGTGIATWLATPSSANLAAAVTDETGTGSLVFAGSPALTGTPTAPTATAGTNTTQLATTAFANAATAVNNPGMIYGLTLSTAGSSTTMNFAAGRATDSTGAVVMVGTALAKTTSAWAAGNANGMLDTGAIANSTQYHMFLIAKADGTTDYLCSLSPTAPTLPATYTYFRRIGSIKTNGSAQWQTFVQNGDKFCFANTIDFTAGGTSVMTLRTLSVPTGIVVCPILSAYMAGGAAAIATMLVAPAANSAASMYAGSADGAGSSSYNINTFVGPPTNTSAQIYVSVPALGGAALAQLITSGWIDLRGKEYLP